MAKRVGKRGDTLIEVMLAVGIFSMVAVAVVAVMSGGTSSAQTALETTLAREEIDAQAEALRFIQSSYIAERDKADGKFAKLWEILTAAEFGNPNNVKVIKEEDKIKNIAQYSPTECSALYDNDGEATEYGFVINTRKLGTFTNAEEVIISDKDNFEPAQSYPRLFYNDSGNLANTAQDDTLQSAQGIYVIAVKDPNSTRIGTDDLKNKSAYYDFYIRTCWYGTGDSNPSTISTVMRLYDPGIAND